jgi:hypothetical protein
MYKKIFIEQEETTYRIYDNGQVMNEKTGRYHKGTIRNGYRWFDLRWKNKKFAKSQHRLLAEAFIGNPNNYEYVHHINNNRLDNRIKNLQWATASENNLKKNKLPSLNDHNDYLDYDLSQEEWKTFRDTIYMVSNLGRVKNVKTNKLLKGKITSSGYREYCLTFNNKKQSFRGHKLTWEVWNGSEQNIINHINGNKLDNRITNLENVTNKENTLKAIYETKTFQFKKTACYDKEGNLIQIFVNNADAARHMGVKPQSIQAAIKKGYCSCGFYWKNIED